MKIKDEVLKVIDSLKKAGFNPVDAVFEGALGVKEDTTLAFMDKLNDSQMVSGVIRVIYTTIDEEKSEYLKKAKAAGYSDERIASDIEKAGWPEDSVRFVEIPVGQSGEEPAGEAESAGKRK